MSLLLLILWIVKTAQSVPAGCGSISLCMTQSCSVQNINCNATGLFAISDGRSCWGDKCFGTCVNYDSSADRVVTETFSNVLTLFGVSDSCREVYRDDLIKCPSVDVRGSSDFGDVQTIDSYKFVRVDSWVITSLWVGIVVLSLGTLLVLFWDVLSNLSNNYVPGFWIGEYATVDRGGEEVVAYTSTNVTGEGPETEIIAYRDEVIQGKFYNRIVGMVGILYGRTRGFKWVGDICINSRIIIVFFLTRKVAVVRGASFVETELSSDIASVSKLVEVSGLALGLTSIFFLFVLSVAMRLSGNAKFAYVAALPALTFPIGIAMSSLGGVTTILSFILTCVIICVLVIVTIFSVVLVGISGMRFGLPQEGTVIPYLQTIWNRLVGLSRSRWWFWFTIAYVVAYVMSYSTTFTVSKIRDPRLRSTRMNGFHQDFDPEIERVTTNAREHLLRTPIPLPPEGKNIKRISNGWLLNNLYYRHIFTELDSVTNPRYNEKCAGFLTIAPTPYGNTQPRPVWSHSLFVADGANVALSFTGMSYDRTYAYWQCTVPYGSENTTCVVDARITDGVSPIMCNLPVHPADYTGSDHIYVCHIKNGTHMLSTMYGGIQVGIWCAAMELVDTAYIEYRLKQVDLLEYERIRSRAQFLPNGTVTFSNTTNGAVTRKKRSTHGHVHEIGNTTGLSQMELNHGVNKTSKFRVPIRHGSLVKRSILAPLILLSGSPPTGSSYLALLASCLVSGVHSGQGIVPLGIVVVPGWYALSRLQQWILEEPPPQLIIDIPVQDPPNEVDIPHDNNSLINHTYALSVAPILMAPYAIPLLPFARGGMKNPLCVINCKTGGNGVSVATFNLFKTRTVDAFTAHSKWNEAQDMVIKGLGDGVVALDARLTATVSRFDLAVRILKARTYMSSNLVTWISDWEALDRSSDRVMETIAEARDLIGCLNDFASTGNVVMCPVLDLTVLTKDLWKDLVVTESIKGYEPTAVNGISDTHEQVIVNGLTLYIAVMGEFYLRGTATDWYEVTSYGILDDGDECFAELYPAPQIAVVSITQRSMFSLISTDPESTDCNGWECLSVDGMIVDLDDTQLAMYQEIIATSATSILVDVESGWYETVKTECNPLRSSRVLWYPNTRTMYIRVDTEIRWKCVRSSDSHTELGIWTGNRVTDIEFDSEAWTCTFDVGAGELVYTIPVAFESSTKPMRVTGLLNVPKSHASRSVISVTDIGPKYTEAELRLQYQSTRAIDENTLTAISARQNLDQHAAKSKGAIVAIQEVPVTSAEGDNGGGWKSTLSLVISFLAFGLSGIGLLIVMRSKPSVSQAPMIIKETAPVTTSTQHLPPTLYPGSTLPPLERTLNAGYGHTKPP